MTTTGGGVYDVCVVGAGPAGLTAAFVAARAGLSVAVVAPAKQRWSRAPSMRTESLHPQLVDLLAALGARSAVQAAAAGPFGQVTTRLGSHYMGDGADHRGVHVDKVTFVDALLQLAEHAGAAVVCDHALAVESRSGGVAVRLKRGERLAGKWAILATGSRMLLDRTRFTPQLRSQPLTAWSGTIRSPTRETITDNAAFLAHANGWSWQAHTSDGNLVWTALSASHDRVRPHVHALAGISVPASVRAANVTWRLTRPLVDRRMLLAGDAGARLDPAFGQGIFSAAASGVMAVHAILRSEGDPSLAGWHLATYDQWLVTRFEQASAALRSHYRLHGINVHRGGESRCLH